MTKSLIVATGLQGTLTKSQSDLLAAVHADGKINLRMLLRATSMRSLNALIQQVDNLVNAGYLEWVS